MKAFRSIVFIFMCFFIYSGAEYSLAQTVDIEISGFDYQPVGMVIATGTTVRWTNLDAVAHTATSDNGDFNSPLLGQNDTFEFTFTTAGEYPYHCTPHPSMKDTITVIDAAGEVFVDIPGFGFSPADIEVDVNTVVTWTNSHTFAHTTTSDDGYWDSGTLNQNDSYSYFFTAVGVFPYKCSFHAATMIGSVTVVDPNSFVCGDFDDNGDVNVLDIIFLIENKFKGGPDPDPLISGDVNNDGSVNILDIIAMIDFKFKDGPGLTCPEA